MKQQSSQILQSSISDASLAVAEIKNDLKISNPAGLFFFCSSKYDLSELSKAFNQHFDCTVIGCTTAGEIALGYKSDGLVALVLSDDAFTLHPIPIADLQSFGLNEAMKSANTVERNLQHSEHLDGDRMFGFLISDGLAMREEDLIARLNQCFQEIEIFGGSAGDNLEFKETLVFYNSEFHSQSAIFTVIEVKDDFRLFKTQHFIPTNKELITTKVEFKKRIVNEINGEPAAIAYAKINGLDPDNLTTSDFAMYPLMINLANEWYIRSIAEVNPDYSLQFYCAIDVGLPLSVASGQDMLERLNEKTDSIAEEFQEIYFTLGCDCILRRVENINKDSIRDFDETFRRLKFIGFNSYGEQYKGVHFNQTMAGVVVGKRKND